MATSSLSAKNSKKPARRHRTPTSLSSELRTLKINRKIDELSKSTHFSCLLPSEIMKQCASVVKTMLMVEHKEPIPSFRGSDAPTPLRPPPIGYTYTDTKESVVLRDTFRTLFGAKHYKFRISTVLNMSSSGGGTVNSTLSNSVLVSNPDFVSLATVFNEYFIVGFTAKWMPVSRYQYPLGGTSTLSIANLPIGKADLQHGQAAYSSLSTLSDNFAVGYHSTGDPFTERWINTENAGRESVVASLTAPTQSWCPVNNASNYQGTLQFLSQSAPPALPFTQVLGTFMCHWEIIFRVRV